MQDALLVVDVQVDFCEGGALAAHDTETLIDTINGLIKDYAEDDRLVIFSRDWHPADHCSFKENGGQWPAHCVAGTRGAEFHPRLLLPNCQGGSLFRLRQHRPGRSARQPRPALACHLRYRHRILRAGQLRGGSCRGTRRDRAQERRAAGQPGKR